MDDAHRARRGVQRRRGPRPERVRCERQVTVMAEDEQVTWRSGRGDGLEQRSRGRAWRDID
ncbi:MAG TPA: hypothetical protein VEK09_12385, partial [Jatrophihabitantaceae bacterium]|nr:hypothetical protein [Jatrophihabitantaceae bacterium]